MTRTDSEWLAVCRRIKAGHMVEDPDAHYHQGKEIPDFCLLMPRPGDKVLDLGCGNGRLAIGLLNYDVDYLGLDPIPESIDFCKEAFAPWSNYRFEHVPLRSPMYAPNGLIDPIDWKIPLPDESIDWAAAISVFTHLETEALAAHYAEEMQRVLKPGGILWTTWFRCPPNKPTTSVGRTAYREAFIVNLLRGMHWETTKNGNGMEPHDQWNVWTRKQ